MYTLEALKEARAHLKENGVISLAFSVGTPELAQKISLMMERAFDGHPPVCLGGEYDVSFSFLQNREGSLTVSPEDLKQLKFLDLTQQLASAKINVDVSDDDWPFFYMPHRAWQVSYLPLIALIVGFTYLLITSLQGQRMSVKEPSFLLLGAGIYVGRD